MSRARDICNQGWKDRRKNLIINGCFRVWQRGTTFTSIANSDFSADRWQYVASTSAVINILEVIQAVSASVPFRYFSIMTPTTADTSFIAGDYAGYDYRIEGLDCAHLQIGSTGAKTVTLSFWHKHTKTGTHSGSLRNGAVDRSYVFEYTQSVTETWEFAEITVDLDQTGTWLVNTSAGLVLHFAFAVGSTYAKTAGSWGAGNYLGSSSQVNNLDSTSNYFRLADVQLEVGSEATTFEQRPYAEELLLCQRYYQIVDGVVVGAGYGHGTTTARILIPMFTEQCGTPSVSLAAAVSNIRIKGNAQSITPSAISLVHMTGNGAVVAFTCTGLISDETYIAYITGGSSIIFDAEF